MSTARRTGGELSGRHRRRPSASRRPDAIAQIARPRGSVRPRAAAAIRPSTPSWLTSSPDSVPTTAPSRSTTIRSEPSTTSSSSEEIRTTASPASARSLISAWISAFAPTSMPRVGSSRSRTRGSRHRTRASRTFCWLPPDSSLTRWSGLDALIRRRVISVSTRASCRRSRDEPRARQRGQGRQHDVLAHRQRRDDPVRLAVLGDEGDAGGDRGPRRAEPDRRRRRPRPTPLSSGCAP